MSADLAVADGLVVTVEYTVHLANGRLLDSTGGCGPLAIFHGSGQLFPALEDRIVGMRAGETRRFAISAAEAFGEHRPELVRTLPRDRLPPDLDLTEGEEYRITVDDKTLRFTLRSLRDDVVEVDFNAPNAGQALTATVTVLDVRRPTAEEDRRGRVG